MCWEAAAAAADDDDDEELLLDAEAFGNGGWFFSGVSLSVRSMTIPTPLLLLLLDTARPPAPAPSFTDSTPAGPGTGAGTPSKQSPPEGMLSMMRLANAKLNGKGRSASNKAWIESK